MKLKWTCLTLTFNLDIRAQVCAGLEHSLLLFIMKRGCICFILITLQLMYRGPLGFDDWLATSVTIKRLTSSTGSGPILLVPHITNLAFTVHCIPMITRNLSSWYVLSRSLYHSLFRVRILMLLLIESIIYCLPDWLIGQVYVSASLEIRVLHLIGE